MSSTEHITVCVCTFRRPDLLKRLLQEVERQETDGLFTFSVMIVDNDGAESAKAVVQKFAAQSRLPVCYAVERRQSIALARNMAVTNAAGEYIAFIDDDEFPSLRWLVTLFRTCKEYGVDGVLGPVHPHFDQTPPEWVVKGKFYDRPTYPTGLVIDWRKGRTGNVLLRRKLFAGQEQPFSPAHRTGEDQEFFGRMIAAGHVFIWCDEAAAYEVVTPIRWNRTFILKRTLFRGTLSRLDRDFGVSQVIKSLVAVPAYTAVLPLSFLLGQHKAMVCLEKLFYHVGRLLAVARIDLLRVPYVTE